MIYIFVYICVIFVCTFYSVTGHHGRTVWLNGPPCINTFEIKKVSEWSDCVFSSNNPYIYYDFIILYTLNMAAIEYGAHESWLPCIFMNTSSMLYCKICSDKIFLHIFLCSSVKTHGCHHTYMTWQSTKFRISGPLRWISTGNRWIHFIKG